MIEDCGSQEMSSQHFQLEPGEQRDIFTHKRGIIWGGYAPGLFAADTNIVSVSYSEISRGHKAIIEGKESGSTKVYLVNLYGPGAGVTDSTDRAYWLDNLDGSKFYFTVDVE